MTSDSILYLGIVVAFATLFFCFLAYIFCKIVSEYSGNKNIMDQNVYRNIEEIVEVPITQTPRYLTLLCRRICQLSILKVFMKPAKKSLDSLAGKLNLNFGRCGSAGL